MVHVVKVDEMNRERKTQSVEETESSEKLWRLESIVAGVEQCEHDNYPTTSGLEKKKKSEKKEEMREYY